MTFEHPALAFGALLAFLPPLLHLLDRRKPRTRRFAAFDLLLRARRGGERRFRVRRVLLMLTRMALLAAIPLALARPHRADAARLAEATEGPKATALVIDGSGSMRYRFGAQDLFGVARKEARRRLANLDASEPATAMLCAASAAPPPLPTGDRAALLEAIDGFVATEEPANLANCIQQAAQALGQSDLPGKRIVVFTDLQQTGWDLGATPPSIPTSRGNLRPEIEVDDVAKGPMPNLALSDLSVTPASAVGAHGYQFAFSVHNYSSEPAANVPVNLEVSGKIVARGFCDLGAFDTQRKTLAANLAAGVVSEGRVTLPADGLMEDNAIPFVVPVPRQARALVVDGAPSSLRYLDEAFFVQTALEGADNAIAVRTVDPESLTARDIDLAAVDLVLLLNVSSLEKEVSSALKEFVDRGGGLLVAMGDRVEPEALNESIGSLLPAQLRLVKTAAQPGAAPGEPGGGSITAQAPAHFTHVDFASSLFSGFTGGTSEGLLDTRIYRYLLVEPPPRDVQVLASYDDGAPAILLARRKSGQVLMITTSLAREWTDWPIRTSFVPVIQQSVLFLAHLEQERLPKIEVVGSRHVFPENGDRLAVSARSVSGADIPIVRSTDGQRRIERLPEVGLVQVNLAGSDGHHIESHEADIPVAFDPRESDTRRLDPREVTARYGGVVQSSAIPADAAGFRQLSFWMQLLVLGVAFFSGEALLAA